MVILDVGKFIRKVFGSGEIVEKDECREGVRVEGRK